MSLRSMAMRAASLGLAAGLMAVAPRQASAQPPSFDFTISGTSTIRGWTCSVPGRVAVTPGGGKPVPGFASGVQGAVVTVQVKTFTCPNDEMREHLLQAMKADQYSEITFRLDRYEPTGAAIQATGSMTILAATRPVSFPITLRETGQGVQVEGNTRLDMTQYGVEPPVVMLGMLKVAPQIRIVFKGLVPAAK